MSSVSASDSNSAVYAETPTDQYTERQKSYSVEAEALSKRVHRMGNVRLLIFVLAVIGVIFSVRSEMAVTALFLIVGGIAAFIWAVVRHNHLTVTYERAQRLVNINTEGLQRLSGEWHSRALRGDAFIDKEHANSSDLDLFGQHSIYQWCCTAMTPGGQSQLADMLRTPAPAADIPLRQQAIKELSTKLDWRQHLQADATVITDKKLHAFSQWTEAPSPEILHSAKARWLLWLPVPTALLWLAVWIAGHPLLSFAAIILLVLQTLIAGIISRTLSSRITTWLKWEDEATTLGTLLSSVEQQDFHAPLNQKLKAQLQPATSTTEHTLSASHSFKQLEGIMGRLSMRHNPFIHFFFNSALLWDLRWIIAIEKWRVNYGKKVQPWLSTFSQVEALCSLSVIHFDHPQWAFPSISSAHTDATATNTPPLKAVALGHPLLSDTDRISNDFQITQQGTAAIITGSNMSGKSTFLRTIGVNLVLAYAGAPVCAKEFHATVRPIFTSMRIADDLSRGVSSFYAELLRIKCIVDAAKRQPILYLIDEIFRGTNSVDRIAGAKEVLKTLSQSDSIGLVSTHDLELSKLAEEQPDHFTNYHFSEYYTDNNIHFSYQIQPGPATTTNARHLIRMVGISQ